MSKINGGDGEWARAPPPTKPILNRIANAIYNPEEKSFLGRTPKRWAIVLTFYSVFYVVLALLFSACMGGLFLTIDPKKPTYTMEKSLIGINPGVAYRPLAPDFAVVRLDMDNSTMQNYLTEQLGEFVERYRNVKQYAFDECNADDNFGYPATPCFFIKLNKIIGWQPECFNDVKSLPAEMTDDLKDYITNHEDKRNKIWMSCFEEYGDQTKIEYPWGRGLSADNYPYMNDQGYLSPLLAVKLTPPANTQVTIRCRFWAKNIVYNKSLKEGTGYTRIQLHITAPANTTGN